MLTRPRIRETLDTKTECLIADFAVAALNMLLAATALGYACAWQDGPFLKEEVRNPVHELLGIPEDRFLVMMVPVGYPGEESARRQKKPFEQRASWNRYAIDRG